MIQNFEGGAKLNSIHTSSRIIPYDKLQVKFFQFTQFQQASVPVYNCLSSIFIKNHPNFGRFLMPTKFRFWSIRHAYHHVTASFISINEPKIIPPCIQAGSCFDLIGSQNFVQGQGSSSFAFVSNISILISKMNRVLVFNPLLLGQA